MKYLTILALAFSASVSHAELVRLSDENVPFVYESRAAIPTPDYKLAEYVSSDYRKARDEFTKRDLFEQIKPVLRQRIAEAGKLTEVYLNVGGRLGDYDFDKGAFPTGISSGTFIPFDNGYAAVFTNGDAVSTIPVSTDVARTLAGELRSSRRTSMVIRGKIVGAKDQHLRYSNRKTVRVEITSIEVELRSGADVGKKML